MAVTESEVRHVALLARLSFSDEELAAMTNELNEILAYVDKLRELDTENVRPFNTPLRRTNVFRDDEVDEMLAHRQALKNAPDEDGGQFRVPGFLPEG